MTGSAARQVQVDGAPTILGAQAFDLLMVLIERRDRLVSRSELIDLVCLPDLDNLRAALDRAPARGRCTAADCAGGRLGVDLARCGPTRRRSRRQPNEQRQREQLLALLRPALPSTEHSQLMPEGAALDDEETARAKRACQKTSAGRTIPVGARAPKPRKTPSGNGRLSISSSVDMVTWRLEQLWRHSTRRALSEEEIQLNTSGQVELKLKTQWRDGTTRLGMSPLELMQRLAALVPPPRTHRHLS
jgi:hypothetical protein